VSAKIKLSQDVEKHVLNIRKFVEEPSLAVITKIQTYCNANGCSENVPCSSKIELIQIRDRFARDFLGLGSSCGEIGIKKVCHAMRDAYPVRRVTFLYLLAEFTDSIERLE